MSDPTQTKLGIQNTKRTAAKVRQLPPEQLGIPSAPGEGRQNDEERWEALRTAAVDAAGDSDFGVAARTAEGEVVTGRPLSRGNSRDVHALELAVWKGFESAQSPIADVAVAGQSVNVPCGRCLQVLADYAQDGSTTIQVTDGDSVSEYTLTDLLR
jgi:cytidine deaminase